MGNCCGKADSFEGEGRVLGSTDDIPARSVQTKPQKSATPSGRTLGTGTSSSLTPGEAAAKAAESRAKTQGGSKGALGQKLDAQKSQSQHAALTQNARDNLAAREADAATQARNYN